MKPDLLPIIERAARFALNQSGFHSRRVQTPLALIHAYEARGRGPLPTTVVLHGIGSSATSFGSTLARLRPHVRRVLAPDLPGHGFSGAPMARVTPETLFASVRAALDVLVVDEPMLLVGNSLGGAMALQYAMEAPQKVSALVLLSPAGARLSTTDWDALVRAFQIESMAEARALLNRLYHRMPWYVPAFAPSLQRTMQRRAVRDILASARPEDLPAPERLGELSMPVLLLWGQSESVMPPSALAYFRRHLPAQALIEEPSGFGHCPHFDNPARLAARLVEFAQQAVRH